MIHHDSRPIKRYHWWGSFELRTLNHILLNFYWLYPTVWVRWPTLVSVTVYLMFEHKQCLKNQSMSKHAGFTGWWFGPL